MVCSSVRPSGMSTTIWISDLLSNGQHLQHHQPHDREARRQHDEPAACWRTAAACGAIRACRARNGRSTRLNRRCRRDRPSAFRARRVRTRAAVPRQQFQRQPRRDDQCHQQRQQHAGRGVDRDGPHVRPHEPGHEGHRQQRRDDRERGEDGGAADLVHRQRDRLAQRALRRAACAGGCSRRRRWRRPPGCRSRRSARTATRGSA